MSDIIKHTDIAEAGALKPLQDEMLKTIEIANMLEGDMKAIAAAIKVVISTTSPDGYKNIKKIADATAQATETEKTAYKISKEKAKVQEKLNYLYSEGANEIAQMNVAASEKLRLNKEDAKLTSEEIGAYERLSTQLNKLRRQWKDLAAANLENTVQGRDLLKQIKELDVNIKKIDATVGQHQRNVGNYASGYNGLANSINQISRELPNFALNVKTGFLAISNNLPILQDELKKATAANKALRLEGQATVPVWKQVTGAVFSWQSALTAGIALSVMFGQQIGDWIEKMIKGKNATMDFAEQTKLLSEARKKAMEGMLSEIVSLESYKAVIDDANTSLTQKKQAYIELQKLIPSLTGLTYEEATANNKLNLALARQLELINLKVEVEALRGLALEEKKQKYLQQQLDDQKKINSLKIEQRDIENKIREIEAGKINPEDNPAALAQRLRDIDKEIGLLSRSTSEKLKAAEAQKLQLEAEIEYDIQSRGLSKNKIDRINKEKEAADRLAAQRERDFDRLMAQLEREQQAEQNALDRQKERDQKEFDNLFAKLEKERDAEQDAKDKARQKELQEEKMALQSSIRLLEQASKKKTDLIQKNIDRELSANQKRQEDLKAIALKGVQDASDTLAFEERKQAELEAKKIKQQKNQKRQELIFAGLKAYSANVGQNPNTALSTTLRDISLLTSALAALPTFFDGTEDTGEHGYGVDGRGGFKAILHPNERVMTKDQNKKVGDLTNDELANLAYMHNLGLAPVVSDDRLLEANQRIVNEILDLKKTIKNRPVKSFDYDPVNKWVIDMVQKEYTTERTSKKAGGLRG